MDNQETPKEFEELSKVISEVISSSTKVTDVINKLTKKNKVNADSFLVLVFKMQSLNDSEETSFETDGDQEKQPGFPLRISQCIDGKILTPNEIAFQEFCVRTFTQEDWLKKLGLTLKEDNDKESE